jgi:hypothetical protein
MNKNERECLISKLNKIIKEISLEESMLQDVIIKKRDKNMEEWIEINLRLLNNQKIMIEQAFINDHLEEL